MTFYYRPSVVDAFAVEYIMTSVNFGWLIRSIHRWSASMMVMLMVLHIPRLLNRWILKPRELTWVTGVILAVVTVSLVLLVIHYHGIK
jgi:cytochrome b6